MKKSTLSFIPLMLALSLMLIVASGCKKDEDPEPVTPAPIATTVKDIDGNVYKTIKIGTQTWMLENLRVTHYRNGEPIPHVTDVTLWPALTTGAYCNYDNSSVNAAVYGRLYNWYAVAEGPLLAPEGWHIPTLNDWITLADYLGGYLVAGAALKDTGTTCWISPNDAATNASGFTALPGGCVLFGGFLDLTTHALWWTQDENSETTAPMIWLGYMDDEMHINAYEKSNGFSVRCVKDN